MKEIIDVIHNTIYQFFDGGEEEVPMSDKDELLLEVNKAICNNLKALEQEPKTGHWITQIKSDRRDDYWPTNPRCSVCGGEPYYSNTIYNYKFCPFCGARMESEE